MSFTAYYELLRLPQATEAFTRLGFTAGYFRVELSWAKVAGVAALLVPMVPARLKERGPTPASVSPRTAGCLGRRSARRRRRWRC
jgi:hypothetical protein